MNITITLISPNPRIHHETNAIHFEKLTSKLFGGNRVRFEIIPISNMQTNPDTHYIEEKRYVPLNSHTVDSNESIMEKIETIADYFNGNVNVTIEQRPNGNMHQSSGINLILTKLPFDWNGVHTPFGTSSGSSTPIFTKNWLKLSAVSPRHRDGHVDNWSYIKYYCSIFLTLPDIKYNSDSGADGRYQEFTHEIATKTMVATVEIRNSGGIVQIHGIPRFNIYGIEGILRKILPGNSSYDIYCMWCGIKKYVRGIIMAKSEYATV